MIGGDHQPDRALQVPGHQGRQGHVLAQIVRLVAAGPGLKAPIQRLADLVAGYFVPAVWSSPSATFVIWFVFGPEPALSLALVSAVAVLIIACPCALGPGDADRRSWSAPARAPSTAS